MGDTPKSRVFLSYARADDEAFAGQLCSDLTESGFDVWWDRERMPNRALTFLQEIRDAIDSCDRLMAVVGPAAVRSDYVRAEWTHALLFAKGVVPILRIGESGQIPGELRSDDFRLLPDELSQFHCPDFRANRDYASALRELVRILEEPVPALGPFLTSVPALPPHFLPQRQLLGNIEGSVLADIRRPVVITAAKQVTALAGMGGIGKSVSAAAFSRSVVARRSFRDGIVWLHIGPHPDLLQQLRLVGQAFGDPALTQSLDLGLAAAMLPKVLESKVALLVLDDVWDVDHATVFVNAAGPRCRLVITSRDRSLGTALNATEHSLDVLDHEAALNLLAEWAQVPRASLPAAARDAAAECGNLPLALALCGAMVHDGAPWEDVVAALAAADLSFVEAKLPNYPYRDVLRTLEVSVEMVRKTDPEAAVRYLELVVFDNGKAVPETAVLTLWGRTGTLREARGRKLLRTFASKSLLRLDSGSADAGGAELQFVSLHDLQYDYVRLKNENAATLKHELLEAYRSKCSGLWWELVPDGYVHSSLVGLVRQEEGEAAAQALLTRYRWLDARLRATGVSGLLEDFEGEWGDAILALLGRTLHQAAWTLAGAAGGDQLAPQLLARLLHRREPEFVRLCGEVITVRSETGRLWLQPLRATLHSPALVRTLAGDGGEVLSLATLPDGRVASGSADKVIRIWDPGTGKLEKTLSGHEGAVWSLALLSDGRLASGCGDSTPIKLWRELVPVDPAAFEFYAIKIWNLETGQAEMTLAGHKDNVTHLAVMPDGCLASGSRDGTVRIWNLITRKTKHIRQVFPQGLIVLPDGEVLILDSGFESWRPETEACVRVFEEYHGTILVPMIELPDGRMAYGRHDSSIGIRARTGELEAVLEGHRAWATALIAFGGDRLASGAKDGTIRLWNLRTLECEARLAAHGTRVSCLAALPGGLLASGSFDGTVRLWHPELAATERDIDQHEQAVRALATLADGKVASASDDGTVGIWDVQSGRCEQRLAGHEGSVRALAVLPDQMLVSGSWDGTVRLWNLKTNDCVRTVTPVKDGDKYPWCKVNALLYCPEGQVIMAGDFGKVALGNIGSTGFAATLQYDGYVLTLLQLPERRVAFGGSDRTIRVCDQHTLWEYVQITGHEDDVSALAVLDDGRLVSGAWDRCMCIWNVATDVYEPMYGHMDAVWAILPVSNRVIISGSRDRTIRIWTHDSKWTSTVGFIANGGITSLAFAGDRRNVVAGDATGRLHYFTLRGAAVGDFALTSSGV